MHLPPFECAETQPVTTDNNPGFNFTLGVGGEFKVEHLNIEAGADVPVPSTPL